MHIMSYILICEAREGREGNVVEERRAALRGARPAWSPSGCSINQNQRSSQSHTRAEEKLHPSTTTGGANPASRSDAGLGGCERERVATALVCETRSFIIILLARLSIITFEWCADDCLYVVFVVYRSRSRSVN